MSCQFVYTCGQKKGSRCRTKVRDGLLCGKHTPRARGPPPEMKRRRAVDQPVLTQRYFPRALANLVVQYSQDIKMNKNGTAALAFFPWEPNGIGHRDHDAVLVDEDLPIHEPKVYEDKVYTGDGHAFATIDKSGQVEAHAASELDSDIDSDSENSEFGSDEEQDWKEKKEQHWKEWVPDRKWAPDRSALERELSFDQKYRAARVRAARLPPAHLRFLSQDPAKRIVGTRRAFAALTESKCVILWGGPRYGGRLPHDPISEGGEARLLPLKSKYYEDGAVVHYIQNVEQLEASDGIFAVLFAPDGQARKSVLIWGHIEEKYVLLHNVTTLVANDQFIVVMTEDGGVESYGGEWWDDVPRPFNGLAPGDDVGEDQKHLYTRDFVQGQAASLSSMRVADQQGFLLEKKDGSMLAWLQGTHYSIPALKLVKGEDVRQILMMAL